MVEEETSPKKFVFKTFYPQAFSVPSGILHYITTTPSSAKGYEKLQKCCKYFYFKKQLIIFDHFKWSGMQKACRNHLNLVDFENSSYKIWITKELIIYGQNNEIFIPTLMPRIYRSDILKLEISYHDISFNDYKILVESGNIKFLTLKEAMIIDKDGSFVPFENILALLPNLSNVVCQYPQNNELIFTSKTAQKLSELPPFKSLKEFVIYGLSAIFNPQHFCNFIAKHENVKYFLQFCATVSPESQHKFTAALNNAWLDYEFHDNAVTMTI